MAVACSVIYYAIWPPGKASDHLTMQAKNSATPNHTQGHNAHLAYRPDIDGLRAIAILSVVIFHAFPTKLHGGFVGVDIFFVISGYLISNIIFRSLLHDNFSFTEFYAHRIKRIFPALILVLAVSFTFGWFALLPDEFMQLGKHIAAGAGFVQNFVLWKEAGYFDSASELKPLMHLWSLAVEEQYYLLYPLIIWSAWRIGMSILVVIAALGLLSFGLNVSNVEQNSVWAFFAPQTRFWELLAGSLLAYLQLSRRIQLAESLKLGSSLRTQHLPHQATFNNLMSALGLLLIVSTVLGLHKDALFPGWFALAPVLGACLLILAGPATWANRNILASRLMVFVGLISYPLYLWHWPILSFAKIVESGIPSVEIRIAAVILSILLSWLTYQLIEKPIRFGRGTWVKTASLCMLVAIVGVVGYITYEHDGLASRSTMQAHAKFIQDLSKDKSRKNHLNCPNELIRDKLKLGYCKQPREELPTYALVGDSHAEHIFHGIAKYDPNSWLLIGNSSCPPVIGIHVIGTVKNCDALMNKALRHVISSPSIHTVVLSFFGNYAHESNYAADHIARGIGPAEVKIQSNEFKSNSKSELFYLGLDRAISALESAHKSVVIVIDIPELPFYPKDCIGRPFTTSTHNCTIERAEVMSRQKTLREAVGRLQANHPRLKTFDPLTSLCDAQFCYAKIDDMLLYRDSHHLSLRGSEFYAQQFLGWLH